MQAPHHHPQVPVIPIIIPDSPSPAPAVWVPLGPSKGTPNHTRSSGPQKLPLTMTKLSSSSSGPGIGSSFQSSGSLRAATTTTTTTITTRTSITRAQQKQPPSSSPSSPLSLSPPSIVSRSLFPSPFFHYSASSSTASTPLSNNSNINSYNTPIVIVSDEEDILMARSKLNTATTTSRRSSGRVSATSTIPKVTPPTKTRPTTLSPRKGRSLRPRKSLSSYADDDGGDDEEGEEEEGDGAYSSQEDDEEEDPDADSLQSASPAEPQAERGVNGNRSLRPRASLGIPEGLRDYVSTDLALGNKKRRQLAPVLSRAQKIAKGKRLPPGKACAACRASRRKCDRKKPRCSGCVKSGSRCYAKEEGMDDGNGGWVDEPDKGTVRGQIRKGMEETARKRERFLLEYGHLFEALLPENNYISKLRAKFAAKNEGGDQISRDNKGTPMNGSSGSELKPGEEPMVSKEIPAVPYKLLEEQPSGVTATMKGYQLSGLSFLVWLYNNGSSGILGDEMGLGKTLQTLSLFSYLTTYHPCPTDQQRPFLVVCPLSVVSSWVAECKKWTPHLRVLRLHGPAEERDRLKKVAESGQVFGLEEGEEGTGAPHGYDVVITSYEVFEREKQWFRRAFVWRYVVLDEGHKIKNEKTNVAGALQGLSAEYRLILTGTPLQNNLTELWALIHWLFPEVFSVNTSKIFSDAFDLTQGKNDLKVMDNARCLLELIMLRRMKESKGVNLGLPKKTEVILYLPLVPMQRFWYKRLLTRLDKGMLEQVFKEAKQKERIEEEDGNVKGKVIIADKDLEELGEGGEQWGETRMIVEKAIKEKTGTQWQKLMNLLMQLRKCCSHPYLLPNAEPYPPVNGPHVILASSKFILLDKLIDELCLKKGQKVLLFSGFTKMLDICEDLMALKGGDGTKFKYGRLDGMTARARRNLAIRLFNSDPDYKVMLISTRAGGLGINLASASNVVMLDSDWNPQADLQAQARAHRIGQTQEVTVYRLITQGTVEEQMMGRIRKKLYLSAKVTESMRDIHTSTSSSKSASSAVDNMPNLTTSQLMSLVRSGSRAIAREEIDPTEMLKWDWETMIGKCRDYSLKLKSEEGAATTGDASDEEEEKRWLSEMEKVETRVFEGKNHVKDNKRDSNYDISAEWTRESRRLGMERVVMVDGHPVLKETIGNSEWEAVATMAGKNPRFAEPEKRKRKAIEHQDYCQICYDGGQLLVCSGCPRTYHHDCLTKEFQIKSNSKMGQFYCPQHQCIDCSQKTTNAGGMLFRCRWCENAYCEDCIDFDKVDLLGDSLVEYDILGVEPSTQAFYVKCEGCIEHHHKSAESQELCEDMEKEWLEIYQVIKLQEEEATEAAEAAAAKKALKGKEEEEVGDMTEGTTAPGSEGALTPAEGEAGPPNVAIGVGKKLAKSKKGPKKISDLSMATPALSMLPAGAGTKSLKRKKSVSTEKAGVTPGKGGVKKKVKIVTVREVVDLD